jgi:hypothetical protein
MISIPSPFAPGATWIFPKLENYRKAPVELQPFFTPSNENLEPNMLLFPGVQIFPSIFFCGFVLMQILCPNSLNPTDNG